MGTFFLKTFFTPLVYVQNNQRVMGIVLRFGCWSTHRPAPHTPRGDPGGSPPDPPAPWVWVHEAPYPPLQPVKWFTTYRGHIPPGSRPCECDALPARRGGDAKGLKQQL